MTSPTDQTGAEREEHAPGGAAVDPAPVDDAEAIAFDDPEQLASVVEEIKQRLTDVASRELEIERRECELARRLQEITDYEPDPAAGHPRSDLAAESAELRRRRSELTRRVQAARATIARQAELERRRQDGDDESVVEAETAQPPDPRAAEIEAAQAAIQAERSELAERRAAVDKLYLQASQIEQRARARFEEAGQFRQKLVAKAAELKEYRRRLEAAQREILTERARLKSDRQTHELLEAELARRRETCEIEAIELSRRSDELARLRAELDHLRSETQAALDQQRAELRAEARRTAEQIKDRVAQIEKRRAALRRHAAELSRQRDELIARARQLQARAAQLDRDATENEARRRKFDEQAAAIDRAEQERRKRSADLDEREARIARGQSELDEARAALARREAEIEERRLVTEKLLAQAADSEQRARQRFEEAAQLQANLQSKEAELASNSLAAELGREEVETERTRLLAERDTLNFLQAEARRIIREGAPAPAPVAAVGPSIAPRPRRWVARAASLAAAAGLIAGWAAWRLDRPMFRGSTRVDVASQRIAPTEAAAELLREWLASGGAVARPQEPVLAAAWDAACAAGRVEVFPAADGAGLDVSLCLADREQAIHVLDGAVRAFAAAVAARPSESLSSPKLFEWDRRRAALEAERTEAQAEVNSVREQLARLEGFDAWDRARAAVEKTQGDFDRVARRLGEQRGTLTALRAQESPRVEVSPHELEAALALDALYQEDVKEIGSIAREHRMTLALALMMTVDPLKDVRAAFAALKAAIDEQRGLQPPEAVAAMLEECAGMLDALDRRLAAAAMAWDQRRAEVERLSPADQLPDLVRLQNEATLAARETTGDAVATAEAISRLVNGISSGGGAGTREMVVASLLRGNLSAVNDRVVVLTEAAAACDLATNFKLETTDRQLRRLRTRIADRRETIRGDLEAASADAAQRSYENQVREMDEDVRTLERQRDELTAAMAAHVAELRSLEDRMQEFRGLRAELQARSDALARIEHRIAQHEADRPNIPPDILTPHAVTTVQVAGEYRARSAWTAAAAAAGATLLVSLLMVVGGTPRRPVS